MQTKSELRKFAKDFRKTLNKSEISEKILQIFLLSKEYLNAKNIALYYPYGSELDITPILQDKNKNFYLPKIDNEDKMYFCKYDTKERLISGKYGIMEPQDEIHQTIFDLMIIPALMADKKGFRLGYGKGYYDKFLSDKQNSGVKVVLIPDKLVTEHLPIDKNDVPVDIIITEERVIKLL